MVRLQDFVKVEGRDRGGNRGWVVRGYGWDLGVAKTGRYCKVPKRLSWCPEITRNRENSSEMGREGDDDAISRQRG